MRQFRNQCTGIIDLRRAPIMRDRHGELALAQGQQDEGFFWCAADKPETEDTALGIWVKPVYIGSDVHELSRCEVCGISIRELQQSMREMLT